MTTGRIEDEESAPQERSGNGGQTERQAQRERENREFVSVVVKRIDQSIRHPDDVLSNAIQEGVEQARRSLSSLFLSAVSAGAILSFVAMAVGVMTTVVAGSDAVGSERLLVALVYPLGFVLCLMSGTQLFTEHTALAVYPVLDRQCGFVAMLRMWIIILSGNLLGCVIGASLLAAAEGVVRAADGYAVVAEHMMSYGAMDTLMSGVLAGWLMALAGWLILATAPDVSQILVIYVTTFLIGVGGLHHSIAGTAEILASAFTGAPVAFGAAVGTLGLAVLGNLVGGALFVAILNYGHIRQTQLRQNDRGGSAEGV